jgi:hypothetical protein
MKKSTSNHQTENHSLSFLFSVSSVFQFGDEFLKIMKKLKAEIEQKTFQ